MSSNYLLKKNNIEVFASAISDYNGKANFHVFNLNRGTGSLLKRRNLIKR